MSSSQSIIQELKNFVRPYLDFPKEGIVFRDFLPLLQNPKLFHGMLTVFQDYINTHFPNAQCIVGIESRGFLIGPTLALKMNLPFVPVRKPGKLPGDVTKECYSLEYGTDALEIQNDSIEAGQKCIIVDDLIATGGSMEAAVKLIRKVGGIVDLCIAVIELEELKGKEKISAPTYSILQF